MGFAGAPIGISEAGTPVARRPRGAVATAPGLAWSRLERETGFEPAASCLGSNGCADAVPATRQRHLSKR